MDGWMDSRPALVPVPATGPAVAEAGTPRSSSGAVAGAFHRLIDSLASHAILLLDKDGHVLTWNKGAEAIKGYRADEVIGQHISVFYTPEAIAVGHPLRELELAALTGNYQEDGWRVRRDGTRFWARVQIQAIRDDLGDLVGFGKVTSDLTESRQKEEQLANVLGLLERTLRIDHLTGLPNRRAWDEALNTEISEARRRRSTLSVAVLDLDHFKLFNDRFGHQAGDLLLKRAALRWRESLGPGDVLARYGGEEFILAVPGSTPDRAHQLVERLLSVTPEGQTLSAGLAVWDFEETTDQLVGRADGALYRAKDNGRNQVHICA